VIHLGDITKLRGDEIPPVDCITGGSPCQDLSVAGKRAGLAGERSGLFMEQIRIVKEMRERDIRNGRTGVHVRPRFMVWENVSGAFSSNKGEDFRAVLEEIVKVVEPDAPDVPLPDKGKWPKAGCLYDELGRWSVAWRVHDAQFWGVPQRRKRIALVADFGGLAAPEVLFERKGLSRDPEPRGETREGTASAVEGSAGGAIFYDAYQHHGWRKSETSGTLTVGQNNTVRGDTPLITAYGIDRADTAECNGKGWREDQSYTLNTIDRPEIYIPDVAHTLSARHDGSPQPDKGNGANIIAFAQNQRDEVRDLRDVAGSIAAEPGVKQQTYVCAGFKHKASGTARGIGFEEEKAPSMLAGQTSAVYDARGNGDGQTVPTIKSVHQNASGEVRENDVAYTIGTNANASGRNTPLVYDARVNGDGETVPNMTGGHQRRVTDYTASCVDAVQTYQEVTGTLNPGAHPGSYNGQDAYNDMLVAASLSARDYKGPCCQDLGNNMANYPIQNSVVRRLTPLECERLQGFPDGWTDIGDWVDSKGKKHKAADSPRYKALGNSIALPFWFWLLRRISEQYERPATLGSLFDGIGGFPLCWERCNGKGTAIWASEIEEFPIAVTKAHFPEVGAT